MYLDQARTTAFADVGFKPQGLYAARLDLAAVAKTDDEQRLFVRTVRENLAQAPGVASVSVGDGVPLDFEYRNTRVARDGESTFIPAHCTRIGAGYSKRSAPGSSRVARLTPAIGTALSASCCSPSRSRAGCSRTGEPLGERVEFALDGSEQHTYTVVGITADLVSTQMGNPRPQLFMSLAQHPGTARPGHRARCSSDASMRGTFANAIAGGLRILPQRIEPDTCSGS